MILSSRSTRQTFTDVLTKDEIVPKGPRGRMVSLNDVLLHRRKRNSGSAAAGALRNTGVVNAWIRVDLVIYRDLGLTAIVPLILGAWIDNPPPRSRKDQDRPVSGNRAVFRQYPKLKEGFIYVIVCLSAISC